MEQNTLRPRRDKETRKRYFPAIDGRTVTARRWAEICGNVLSDQGGQDQVSEIRLHLVRRLSAITTMLEDMEAGHVQGQAVDLDAYVTLVNTATRLSNTLGLGRKTKGVPDLSEYLNNRSNGSALDGDVLPPKRKIARARFDDDDEDDE